MALMAYIGSAPHNPIGMVKYDPFGDAKPSIEGLANASAMWAMASPEGTWDEAQISGGKQPQRLEETSGWMAMDGRGSRFEFNQTNQTMWNIVK